MSVNENKTGQTRDEVYAYLASCDSHLTLDTYLRLKDGRIDKDYVVIKDAAPRIVTEVVTRFKYVSLNEQGLVIPLDKKYGSSD